jgi:hypothetical protein
LSPDRERGFIVVQRQIQSSPLWLSLSGEQRSVFMSILLLANWLPGRFMFGTEWVEVGRGELAHSLETIAKHASVSIKVVRTTLAKLIAGQVLGTRKGTTSGTGPRILIVNNYNKHQSTPEEAGTVFGTPRGTAGARQGHALGTAGAPIEQEQPFNKETLSPRQAGDAARQALSGLPHFDTENPATAVVLANLRERGILIRHAQTPEDRASLEQAIAQATTAVATDRIAESYRVSKRASLGWHLEAITGQTKAKANPKRGMAPPSTDFTSPEATTL